MKESKQEESDVKSTSRPKLKLKSKRSKNIQQKRSMKRTVIPTSESNEKNKLEYVENELKPDSNEEVEQELEIEKFKLTNTERDIKPNLTERKQIS